MSSTYLVVPIRFSAAHKEDEFPKLVSDIALNALDISANESRVAATIRMLNTSNRSAEYVSNRLMQDTMYNGENALIFEIGGLQASMAPSPIWTQGLLEHIKELRASGVRATIICVFPCSLQPAAIEFRDVKVSVEEHDLIAIYNDGKVLRKGSGKELQEIVTVPEIADLYRENSAARRKKLVSSFVRRPGAFRFDDQSAVYPFRYTIWENRTEILDLVADMIANACDREEVNQITFWSGELWFAQMIETLSLDHRLQHLSFVKSTRSDMPPENDQPYVHFVPFFGSGYDLSRAINVAAVRPRAVVSIGCTLDLDEEEQAGRTSTILTLPSGATLPLEYVFTVPGSSDDLVKLWQEVDVDEGQFLPDASETWDGSWSISPPAFWSMALETGFGQEKYGSERDMLENVPPMQELVGRNGAFLAEKIISFTEEKFGAPPDRSIIFVRIDEAGTEPLNEILGNAMDRVVISVQRELLNKLDGGSEVTLTDLLADEDVSGNAEDFLASFRHAQQEVGCTRPEHAKVVILDEFVVTGRSMKQLSRLLKMMNSENYQKLALFDFGPGQTDQVINSLYQLRLE